MLIEKIDRSRIIKLLLRTKQLDYHVANITTVKSRGKKTSSDRNMKLHIDFSAGGHFENWKKTDFLLNGKRPINNIDRIYSIIQQPLNELSFKAKKGIIVQLDNHDELLESWELTKLKLEDEFAGEVVQSLVSRADKRFRNKNYLLDLINEDLELQHIHQCLKFDRQEQHSKAESGFFGIIKGAYLPVITRNKIDVTSERIHLNANSTLRDTTGNEKAILKYFSKKLPEFKLHDLNFTVETNTVLDKKTLWIIEANTTYKLWTENGDYKKEIKQKMTQV